mmetsp:Transcript_3795/g.8358  ORF Transcript_3795/g.8358 Transcript_3795/m.8358 type:complete len:399 (-) Transcript_3795:47-1243(-)
MVGMSEGVKGVVVGKNTSQHDRNQGATVYVGGLEERVSESLLWELMTQVGRVRHVYIPRDRVTGAAHGYGFVEFKTVQDAEYAAKVMNMVCLYDKPIRVQLSSVEREKLDVGANLFVGNLHDDVDEKTLHDVFSTFGELIDTPHITRDVDSGESKHFGFVKFASFTAADNAIRAMNGQYVCGRPISVQYAFKKDSRGERHGSHAERVLAAAAEAQQNQQQLKQQQHHPPFSTTPAQQPTPLGSHFGAVPTAAVPPPHPHQIAVPSAALPFLPGPSNNPLVFASSPQLPAGMPPLPAPYAAAPPPITTPGSTSAVPFPAVPYPPLSQPATTHPHHPANHPPLQFPPHFINTIPAAALNPAPFAQPPLPPHLTTVHPQHHAAALNQFQPHHQPPPPPPPP